MPTPTALISTPGRTLKICHANLLQWSIFSSFPHVSVSAPGLSRGAGSPPSTCWQHCLTQPRRLLATSTTRARCWLLVNLVLSKTLRAFSEVGSSLLWCLGPFLGTSLCWTPPGSCRPISPACPGPSPPASLPSTNLLTEHPNHPGH